jgi:hypothetical protein
MIVQVSEANVRRATHVTNKKPTMRQDARFIARGWSHRI